MGAISPNWAPRPAGLPVTALVLHYTGMPDVESARQRLCDPQAQVSAHYLLDEAGGLECLVPEAVTAWHAGRSAWRAMDGLNAHSIGVEIVNPGHEWGYRAFPDVQIARLLALMQEIVARHPIPRANILAHSDVAPARKEDPGELFPWQLLASKGLGVWPMARNCAPDDRSASAMLRAIGYRLDQADTGLVDVVRAFQRRYRPSRIDGVLDHETMGLICGLAAEIDRT